MDAFAVEMCLHCAGEQEIPGLTDVTIPRRLGPKRASKIRKLFNLRKEDDVRQYVVRRPLAAKEGKHGVLSLAHNVIHSLNYNVPNCVDCIKKVKVAHTQLPSIGFWS